MTPQEIGAYLGALFVGAASVPVVKRIQRSRNEGGNDPERPLGLDDARALLRDEARLTRVETRVEDMVRRMDERDRRAEEERVALLAAIEKNGDRSEAACQRVEQKVEDLRSLVYERRGEARA